MVNDGVTGVLAGPELGDVLLGGQAISQPKRLHEFLHTVCVLEGNGRVWAKEKETER